jgi:hypothetical protein
MHAHTILFGEQNSKNILTGNCQPWILYLVIDWRECQPITTATLHTNTLKKMSKLFYDVYISNFNFVE